MSLYQVWSILITALGPEMLRRRDSWRRVVKLVARRGVRIVRSGFWVLGLGLSGFRAVGAGVGVV